MDKEQYFKYCIKICNINMKINNITSKFTIVLNKENNKYNTNSKNSKNKAYKKLKIQKKNY